MFSQQWDEDFQWSVASKETPPVALAPTNIPGSFPVRTLPSSPSTMKSSFPIKLHELLDEAERLPCLKAIVSWQPHGRAFVVHNSFLFIQEANKRRSFFKQTKYPSFQRQLNIYGFRRISTGVDKGAYHHRLFLRGQRGLAYRIPRIMLKGTKVRKPASPENEPDFYSMPFMPPSDSGAELQHKSQPVVCQTRLPKSNCSQSALAFMQNDTVDKELGPCDGRNGNDFTVIHLMDHCEDVNQSTDTGTLNYCKTTLEETEDPPPLSAKNKLYPLQNEGHQRPIMESSSCLTEHMIMAKSADLEGRINSVMPLKSSKKICPTSLVKVLSPRTDMTNHQMPFRIARTAIVSPDRTHAIRPQSQVKQSCQEACMMPVRDDIPFVLHLQLPTISDQSAATSKGPTFVRALASQPIEIDVEVPRVSAQKDKSDHLSVAISSFIQGVSKEEQDFYSIDKSSRDCHVRIPSWSTIRQDDNLGLEGLPADTELEEYIACHMNGMDRS